MVLPRWLAQTNRLLTNRVLGLLPRRSSPFVVLHHVGRRTGARYTTLLAAFSTGDGFVLTPTYGPDADWVRNVMASGAFVIDRRGTRVPLSNARLVTRTEAWPYLPALIRLAMRLLRVRWYVRADLT
ncbi:MAG: nitroreductase family deazaflavin-dependent oxidoreductase [Acidimicrobiia bacterium]|nr:nitroreductase family deazaflavin-dependent oxidoreductase [Acidimicrobiia bacterium]